MANDLWLYELTVYDPSVRAEITLRYSTGQGHTTGGSETPASTYYAPVVQDQPDIRRDLFDRGTTSGRSRVGYGDLTLLNPDGALDALLTYGFSGRALVARRGTVGAAYPAGFPVVWSGAMEQPEVRNDTLLVKLRDNQADLLRPFQTNLYAGTNSLPAGLEGVAGDIAGRPKPLALGAPQNIGAVGVNTAKLIYQLHDGALAYVLGLYDQGVALGTFFPMAARTSGAGTDTLRCAVVGPSLVIVAGDNGKLSTSSDSGLTWTARTSGFGAGAIYGLAYGGGMYVAVGAGGVLTSSTDGITWTARTSAFGATDIRAVTWGNGLFVAVGASGKASTSPDGVTWTAQTTGFSYDFRGIAYGAGVFVAVGGQSITAFGITYGFTADSTNGGVTWAVRSFTAPVADFAANLWATGIAYTGNGLWVIVGEGATVFVASDYIYYSQRDSGMDSSVFGFTGVTALPDGRVVAVGNQTGASAARYALLSSDTYSWVAVDTTLTGSVEGLYYEAATGFLGVIGASGQLFNGDAASGDYTDVDALQLDADAPNAGEYKTYLAGGYVRLGAPPAGLITADVAQGATVAARTAGQLFAAVLTRAGKAAGTAAGNWLAADVTALDTANAAVLGYWTAEPTTFAEVLDWIANSVGAWWGVDAAGRYRIVRFVAPSGTAVLALTANDLLRPLARVPLAADESHGLPTWRTTLAYARNYEPLGGAGAPTALELESGGSGGLGDARRTFLTREWRTVTVEDRAVLNAHLLAASLSEETLLQQPADALAEATRRQVMRGQLRHRYEVVLQLNDDTDALDLGDVVSLTHTRYGLSAGALYRIIGLAPNARSRQLTLQLWGPADATSLCRIAPLVLAGTGTNYPQRVTGTGTIAVNTFVVPAGSGFQAARVGTGSASAKKLVLAGTGTVLV